MTKSPSPRASRTGVPIRVMMRMLATTYGESVSSMPIFDRGEPRGPMLNGVTYMVRPGGTVTGERLRNDLGLTNHRPFP